MRSLPSYASITVTSREAQQVNRTDQLKRDVLRHLEDSRALIEALPRPQEIAIFAKYDRNDPDSSPVIVCQFRSWHPKRNAKIG